MLSAAIALRNLDLWRSAAPKAAKTAAGRAADSIRPTALGFPNTAPKSI